MIITLTFKTPGVIEQALDQLPIEEEDEDNPYFREEAEEGLQEKLGKWLKWGELVTIEFDLDAGTATVREVS